MITNTDQKRRKQDVYLTPPEVAEAILGHITDVKNVLPHPARILDIGSGEGVWGHAARCLWGSNPLNPYIEGAELRDISIPEGYADVRFGDFLDEKLVKPFNLIMGNPPYDIKNEIVMKVFEEGWLVPGGHMVFLLPLQFLQGRWRFKNMFQPLPLAKVMVIVDRISFYKTEKSSTNDTSYAAFYWRLGHTGLPLLRWLDTRNNVQDSTIARGGSRECLTNIL